MSGLLAHKWYRAGRFTSTLLQHNIVADYNVAAGVDKQDNGSFNGNFSLTTNIKGAGSGSVSYVLTDEKGNTILSEDKAVNAKNNDEMVNSPQRPSRTLLLGVLNILTYYTLLITLKDKNGNVTEQTGSKVGFRTIEIKNKQLCVKRNTYPRKGCQQT